MITQIFNYYPNLFSSHFKRISLEHYVSFLKQNECPFKKGTEDYTRFKTEETPTLAVNAHFSSIPSYESFVEATGYLFCDVDGVDDVEAVKSKYFDSRPFIAMSYRSLSGTGLHFIIRISDDLKKLIDRARGHNVAAILRKINTKYFDGILDQKSFKINQSAATGCDKNPRFRKNPHGVHVDLDENDIVIPQGRELKSSQELPLDWDVSRQSYFRQILTSYPAIRPRYIHYYNRPLDSDLADLLTWYEEVINPAYLNDFHLKTRLSNKYWEIEKASYKAIVLDERIETQDIVTLVTSNKGARKNRLLVESSKLLFNNPFLNFKKFYGILELFNKLFIRPLLPDKIVYGIASRQYRLFSCGRMKFPKPIMRKVFFSEMSNISNAERSKLAKSVGDEERKSEKIRSMKERVTAVVVDMHAKKEKITNKELAKRSRIPLRTFMRFKTRLL